MRTPLQALSSQTSSFMSAFDDVETVTSSLMTIWDACDPGQQPEYPEHRMRHMLHLISHDITAFTVHKLTGALSEQSLSVAQPLSNPPGSRLWGSLTPAEIAASESSISDALSMLQTWRERHVKQLMLDWMPGPRKISAHVWSGSAFVDKHLDDHIARFEQVQHLLGLKREMLKALGHEERTVVHDAFAILGTAEPFMVCAHPQCRTLIDELALHASLHSRHN